MNGFINLNKPLGFTSFDCVAKMRGILHMKKIGHAGTLDPDASGVLPIAVGQATRLLEYVTLATKKYRAGIKFGIKTTTQDASGEITAEKPCPKLTKQDVLQVLPLFTGEINQIPPMYSAIKVGGKRLYELARQNIEIHREPRKVKIYQLDLVEFKSGDFPEAVIDVVCSKGTYIRTLIEDIGEQLATHAHMNHLVRLGVGEFLIGNTVTFEEIASSVELGNFDFLLPLDYQLADLGRVAVDAQQVKLVQNGVAIRKEDLVDFIFDVENVYRIYHKQQLIAVGKLHGDTLKVEKVFVQRKIDCVNT